MAEAAFTRWPVKDLRIKLKSTVRVRKTILWSAGFSRRRLAAPCVQDFAFRVWPSLHPWRQT